MHLFFGLPAFDERMEFFERYGKKASVWEEGLTKEWLGSKSEGLSGADIAEAIRVARLIAFDAGSFKDADTLLLKQEHFVRAFEQVRNSKTDEDRKTLMASGKARPKLTLHQALQALERDIKKQRKR